MKYSWMCIVLLMTVVAWGQVMPSQRGGAIDANNQIGSGGYNSAVRNYIPNAANLFMTGNVAGGRGFRGYSPVMGSNSLYMSLPSSSMSNFRADSIGVGDVTRGRTNYQFNPYFDYSNTVANVGTIAAQRNRPGTTIPLSPYTMPSGYNFNDATKASTLTRLNSVDPGYNPAQDSLKLHFNPYSSVPQTYQEQLRDPHTRLANSSLFGIGVENPQTVATYEAPRLRDVTMESDQQERVDPSRRVLNLLDDDRSDLEGTHPGIMQPGETDMPEPNSSITRPLNPVAAEEAEAAAMYEQEGYSAYDDFRGAVDFLNQQQQTEESGQVNEADAYQKALEIANAQSSKVFKSFAGDRKTRANEAIREAESLVYEGKYYAAESKYRQAALFQSSNPFVYIGWGNSLLFAGDYISALHQLSRGIERFPEIGQFRMDLPSFLGDPTVLELRRADLEDRLADKEDYRLRFLLGWMEYFSGLEKYGLPNLQKAAAEAPANSAIARFPELLPKASGSPDAQ